MKTSIEEVELEKDCEIVGFVEKIRSQKTMIFLILKDKTGEIQVAIEKSRCPEIVEKIESLLKGSVVRIKGKAIKAEQVKLGGREFIPESVIVESVAELQPIDSESSQDLKMDYRWLDLRDDRKRLIFEIRTFTEAVMREYFVRNGYIEIHTPKITGQCSEGGAEVFALNYYDQKAYLTQSPQFYKQMAMAAGFDKVFEIGPYYRAEKSFTARHTAESVCLDFEVAGISSHYDIMDIEEEWLIEVLTKIKEKYGNVIKDTFGIEVELPSGKIPRFKLSEVFKIFENEYGIKTPEVKQLDLDPEAEKLICKYAKDKLGSDVVFVIDYPAEARAFYSRKEKEDSFECMSLDLLYRGWEMNSGAMRENRYEILKKQISEKGIDPNNMKDYLEFFRYGCPPHGGIGFGIDRFIAKLLDLQSIKESIFIFRGPSRLVP